MKKSHKLIILIVFLLLLPYIPYTIYHIPTAFAQEATSTPIKSGSTPTPVVSADIKAKLKALQEEIASKAGKLKLEMSKKLQNKIFVGTITSKDTATFVVTNELSSHSKDNKKDTKNVEVKDYTEYLGKGKITYKNLAVNDFVVVLGDIDDKDILIAKKIIKTSAIKAEERLVVAGQVVSIEGKAITIQAKEDQKLTFTVDTKVKIKSDNGVLADIKAGSPITAVLLRLNDGSLKARLVYLLPKDGVKKISPTPTLTATPTAKPKKK